MKALRDWEREDDAPVTIRWAILDIPALGVRELLVRPPLGLRLIVDRVKADDTLKEDVQLRVRARILGDLEERLEEV
jgi:hypothetical protein